MAVYTPIDYAIAFVILLIIIEFSTKVLFKKIPFDRNFVIASVPVMVLAISIRVLADAGVYQKNDYWSVTPGIYVLAFAFGFACYSIGYAINRNDYWKIAAALETPFALYFAYKLFLEIENLRNMFYPFFAASLLTGFIYLVLMYSDNVSFFSKYTLKKIARRENFAIIFAHMLDASSSFIGIDYFGFAEEHILPEFFIRFAGTGAIMIPLKLIVVMPALYFLESYAEEKKEKKEEDLYYSMIKFIFFILGIGPGTRNSLLLGLK